MISNYPQSISNWKKSLYYQTIVGTPFLVLSSQSSVNGRPCVTEVSRNGRSNKVLKPKRKFLYKYLNQLFF
jgi:hypothetical protein